MKHKPYTLQNFIPVAAPATRKPCREDERSFRLSMGFLPQWYTEHCGIRFGRRWHENCEYRYDTLFRMKQYLHRVFPSVPEFAPRISSRGFDSDCATLSGVYGSKTVAMLYGFEVIFPDDDWPADASSSPLPEKTLRNLSPINLNANPYMEKLEEQMAQMKRCFGIIEGYLNYQGVLNVAQKLRGNEIFVDLIADPEFAADLFSHISCTLRNFALRVQKIQRESGADIDLMSVSNCVVNMISPDMYEHFILPHDMMLSNHFARFGVHTCNWDVTPYLSKLTRIKKMGYLDMSAMSDIEEARRLFPDTRLAFFLSIDQIENMPLEKMEQELRRIARVACPCDIILADMPTAISIEKLNRLIRIAERIEGEYQ